MTDRITVASPAQRGGKHVSLKPAGARGIGRVVALVVVLAITLAACAPRTGAPPPVAESGGSAALEPKTITLGAVGNTLSDGPFFVAEAKGFFEAERLTVDRVIVGQSAGVCQNLVARAVDMGNCSLNDMVQAVEAGGAPLVAVMTQTFTSLDYGVNVKPGLSSWADLRGKTVIVGGPQDNTVFFFRTMARAAGLRDDEYDFQYAGSTPSRYAALKSGGVDAAILTDPFDFQADQEGYRKLDSLVPKFLNANNYAGVSTAARSDWAKEHADEITRWIRAYTRAVRWMYDPANREEVFAILGPVLNLNQESFDHIYQKNFADGQMWSPDGRITETGMQGVLKALAELGFLQEPLPPAGKFFDMTYVERAGQTPGPKALY